MLLNLSFLYFFIYSDEQCSVTAKDVFQKKPDIKSVQNKVTVIKQGAQKRAAFSYQQPNFRTLTNLNKKMKSEEPTSSQINQSSPPRLIITPSHSSEIVILDNSSSSKPIIGKHNCINCQKQFTYAQSLYQHKKSKIHKDEV